MKEIRAAPQSPCGKPECINKVCKDPYHCKPYQKFLKAIRQK